MGLKQKKRKKDKFTKSAFFNLLEDPAIKEQVDRADWLRSFLILPAIWRNIQYITSCVPGVSKNQDKAFAVFCKKIQDAYKKYVVNSKWTEEELRLIIIIMVHEGIYLTYESIEKVKTHIEQGFYTEYIKQKKKEIEEELSQELQEKQEQLDDIDWGDIL